MTILGIDVSHYQGEPNFAAVKAAGIGFVFMKGTQGASFVDPEFHTNRTNAHAAGLSVGIYHFAQNTNASVEANYFCSVVGSLNHGDLVALDWEVAGADPVGWSLLWLRTVESRLGVKPLLYLNQSTVAAHDWTPVVKEDYGLWLADYDFNSGSVPTVAHWPFVAIKQYSDRGVVSGVAGAVDLDVFEGDAIALAKYGYGGVAPAPVPAPVPKPTPPPPAPHPAPAPAPHPAPAPNDGSSLPTMSYGQTSNHVLALQKFLNAYNWRPALPLLPTTGFYGPATAAVLHHAGLQLHVQGDTDGHNFGPHFKAAFWRIGFRG